MKAKISLSFYSIEDARIVHDSICPDNSPLPTGLELNTKIDGCDVVMYISTSRGIESFTTTIEDILGSIDLSIRVNELVTE